MDYPSFTAEELALPGVLRITPPVSRDERGLSLRSYNAEEFAALGIHSRFVQDYVSYSRQGVLRGLHFQRAPHMQDKLVRCSQGEIFDVVADCNPASPTFGQHITVALPAGEQVMLFIPGKYAHGFCVVSDGAIVEYKLSDVYHPESVGGARFDDPRLSILWPISAPVISEQDKSWPPLSPHL